MRSSLPFEWRLLKKTTAPGSGREITEFFFKWKYKSDPLLKIQRETDWPEAEGHRRSRGVW